MISLATRNTPPVTAAFASSTSPRRGTAENVTRTSPDEYSLVMASTPRMPVMSCPSRTPASRLLAGSLCAPRVLWPTKNPSATVPAMPASSVNRTDRRPRSLIHSIRATCPNV